MLIVLPFLLVLLKEQLTSASDKMLFNSFAGVLFEKVLTGSYWFFGDDVL